MPRGRPAPGLQVKRQVASGALSESDMTIAPQTMRAGAVMCRTTLERYISNTANNESGIPIGSQGMRAIKARIERHKKDLGHICIKWVSDGPGWVKSGPPWVSDGPARYVLFIS